ncbi:hypothetical protein M231_04136 [Tremella mesenterica]|uniref:Uncharacterized protein n=1 Tax=Tremella mesenterica TaxID=5217 RepID=A0A4Q1BLR6_TREME|nr:hypothetical protein M231_04136 [Tremella mesenterica]
MLTLPPVPPRKSFSLSSHPHPHSHLPNKSRSPYSRLDSSTTTTSPTKARPRRSLSTDTYGLEGTAPLTAGQKTAAEEKKASRHADVIDTWDPTGLGSAMWHHSGPYDAAAPSRNLNLPPSKAPMQAFHGPPVTSPPRGVATISLSSPPPVPGKIPTGDVPEMPTRPVRKGQSAIRDKHTQSRRVSGGGLTGQYSTSMPSSGAYFPVLRENGMEDTQPRKGWNNALKEAWGTQDPEPFEDFGQSPGEMQEFDFSAGPAVPVDEYAVEPKPLRSPGLRNAPAPRSPGMREDMPSPSSEMPPGAYRTNSNTAGGPPTGGVKRTKSLMQKLKTMVRQRASSIEDSANFRPQLPNHRPLMHPGMRAPSSPGWAEDDAVEEELADNMDGRYADADAEDIFTSPRATPTPTGPGEMGQWTGRTERQVRSEGRKPRRHN